MTSRDWRKPEVASKLASSNSSVKEQDGRYGNSSKQLWKEWEASYSDKKTETGFGLSEKDTLTKEEVKG